MKSYCWIVALALFAVPWTAVADPVEPPEQVEPTPPPVNVAGRLLEKGTRRPLNDVTVYVLPHKIEVVTDAQGEFATQVPPGPCRFIVNLTGYYRFEQAATCSNALRPTFYIEKASYQATFETTIVGQEEKRDATSRGLTREQFETLPGSGGDPIRAVANLPGVNRTSGFSANVVIQGASPDETSYLVDGHEVPLIFHFGGLSTVVFPEAIERVDYLSAGYGPEFSRALGGLVGVTTRSPRRDRLHGLAFVDLINAGGLLEGGVGTRHGFLLSARQSYIGDVLAAAVGDDEDFNLTVAPRFSDITGIWESDISSKQRFRLTALGSVDTLEFLLKNPVNQDPALRGSFRTATRFFRIIPQLRTEHSGRLSSDFSLGFGWNAISVDTDANFFFLRVWSITPRAELALIPNDEWKAFIGTDNRLGLATVDLSLPSTFSVGGVGNPLAASERVDTEVKQAFQELGLYVRNVFHRDGNPWTVVQGVRLDYFSFTDETFLDPRLGLKYQLSDTLSLRANGGRYHQAPAAREVSEDAGNPELATPSAWHLATGIDGDFRRGSTDGLTASTGAFFRWFDDAVVPSAALVQRNGSLQPEYFNNSASGSAFGGELLTRYNRKPWSVWLAYTLLNSERFEPLRGTYPAPFDQTHNLNLIGSVELPANWKLSTRFRLVTGNPVTPIVGSVYDADNDTFIPVRGPLYSERVDTFYQLDLRVDKKWIFNSWILSLYLDVQNVTNTKNVESIRYAYDYSTSTTVEGLPIVPTLGIKGEF